MYRDYENPQALENKLAELKKQHNSLKSDPDVGTDELMDIVLYIEELQNRINFAYQDEESEEYDY